MRTMRWAAAGVVSAAGLAASAGFAAPARADEESLKKELQETRDQVRKLTQRVEELESRPAGSGDLGKAVDAYLAAHPPAGGGGGAGGGGAMGMGNVSAPSSKSLKFSGHVVFWWEQLNGVYRTNNPGGIKQNDIGWLRTSLQADATISTDLRARVEIRDARALGQEPTTTGQLQTPTGGTDVKQGWFEADDFAGSGLRVRAGRQVLSYGDQRLVGEFDWHTYGRSFDGLLFTRVCETTGTKVDAFAMKVMENGLGTIAPGAGIGDRSLYGIYTVTPKALGHSDLDAYVLLLKDNLDMPGEAGTAGGTGKTGIWTGGVRLAGAKDNLDWGTEWALQRGEVAGDRLAAWAGSVRAGYTMSDTGWTPRLGVEWDMATGDDDPTDGDRGSFQTLFPTNHMHYGIMDVAAWQNLQAYRASVEVRPSKTWTVSADYWRLYVDDASDAWYAAGGGVIRPGAAGASKYLGSEADLVLSWKASDRMRIDFGGAQFWAGGFANDTGGGNDALWLYFRIQVWF